MLLSHIRVDPSDKNNMNAIKSIDGEDFCFILKEKQEKNDSILKKENIT